VQKVILPVNRQHLCKSAGSRAFTAIGVSRGVTKIHTAYKGRPRKIILTAGL